MHSLRSTQVLAKPHLRGNLEYKLDTMAPLNAIKHAAHTAIGDCVATQEIASIIKKKALFT